VKPGEPTAVRRRVTRFRNVTRRLTAVGSPRLRYAVGGAGSNSRGSVDSRWQPSRVIR